MAMNMAGSFGVAAPRPAQARHGGDQRHADGRRNAGAVDHLHGVGAAFDGRCAARLPQTQRKSLGADKTPLQLRRYPRKVFINDTEVAMADLIPKLKAITEAAAAGMSV